MTNELAAAPTATAIEQVLIGGDLSKLNPDQRLSYYKNVCESVGLNPLTKPFDYLTLNGKMVLYAKRDATDQLRKIHGVSLKITARETVEGVYVVTASATDKHSRVDESTGAVTISGLKGDNLANALMKAETKAKRRVTLSICGLGLLDETELETIPQTAQAPVDITPTAPPKMAAKLAAIEAPKAEPENPIIATGRKIYKAMKEAQSDDARAAIMVDYLDELKELESAAPKAFAAINAIYQQKEAA